MLAVCLGKGTLPSCLKANGVPTGESTFGPRESNIANALNYMGLRLSEVGRSPVDPCRMQPRKWIILATERFKVMAPTGGGLG